MFLFLLAFAQLGQAQVSDRKVNLDSLSAAKLDSIIVETPKERKPGAALRWALIPGGGQVYNKAWWKVPIVYGALFGAIGYADFNQTNFNRAQTALRAKCFGVDDPTNCVETTHEFTGTPLDDTQALRNIRDNFDRQTQNAYIFLLLTYVLQGVEAFTDAHLKTFDVEDDIGFLQIGPITQPGELMGYGLTVPLGSGRKMKRQELQLKRLVGR